MKRTEGAFLLAQALVVAAVLALLILPLNSGNLTRVSSTAASSTTEPSLASESATNSSADGLQLIVTVSPPAPTAGQNISITISLFNSLSSPLNVLTADALAQGVTPPQWVVNGFPVAMWGGCNGLEPVEFMVVKGDYSIEQLSSASANSSVYEATRLSPFGCAEGGSVENIEFRPHSSLANATGTFCAGVCSPESHLWNLTSTFTVSGYWAYPINSSEASDVATPPSPECTSSGIPDCTTFNYPEVSPFAQHGFITGQYTLAVADEWGQAVVLRFAVAAGATSTQRAPGLPPGCAFAKTVDFGGVAEDIYVSPAPPLRSTVCIFVHVQSQPEFPAPITFTITNSTDYVFFISQCAVIQGEPASCSTSWDTAQSFKGLVPAGGSYRLLISFGGQLMDTGISFIVSA